MTSLPMRARLTTGAVALALGVASTAHAGAPRTIPPLSLTDWETTRLDGSLQQDTSAPGFGTLSAALATACGSRCRGLFGWPTNIDFNLDGGPGEWLSDASASAGHNSAEATGSIPSSGSTSSTFVYTLDDLSASVLSDGHVGSSAAAGALAWDDLSFEGVTAGETGTLSLTLTLTPGSADAFGIGGACLSINSLCNAFTKTLLNGSNTTETLSTTFALSSSKPTLIFDALYALASGHHEASGADLEGVLTLTLPGNVSFTAASGDSGGPTSPVPVPAAGWLLLSGLGAAGVLGRRRRPA